MRLAVISGLKGPFRSLRRLEMDVSPSCDKNIKGATSTEGNRVHTHTHTHEESAMAVISTHYNVILRNEAKRVFK